jgi:ABC-type multidrug transport system ATPase subunit/CRP-like cAMP-binding protein/ABC-type multidrug transport system permease subunit
MTSERTISGDDLRRVPFFAGCSDDDLAAIASSVEIVRREADATIFREGDPGAEMYIVAAGQVRIASDADTEKVVFAHLGPGDFFGEMALVTGAPRSAAAIAATDVELWTLTKDRFDDIQKTHPAISTEIMRILGERVRRGNVQQFQNEAFALLTLSDERNELTIGRLPENDLVISDPQIAGVHARVRRLEGRWVIYDQDTATGTYVNRKRVKVADLEDGDEILIGTNKVFLDGVTVKQFAGREGVSIEARDLTRVAAGKTILDGVSLAIHPGEFVAIVGGSGAGKTTLMHALNGFVPATEGEVRYDSVSLYDNIALFRPVLGYVPQDDIVHPQLTVERTLYYGAKLRLPSDTREAEIASRVDEVLEAVGLTERRKLRVKNLSGGQRKRVSVALELLARPKAVFMDEPTSGLDPALEGRMMALFRNLSEAGATVIVSTHATQNLRMCDRVIWMAPGGKMVFFGSPAEALRHFGVQSFEEIYPLVETEEDRDRWAGAFVGSHAHEANVAQRLAAPSTDGAGAIAEAPVPARRTSPNALRQTYWLTRRYAEVLTRDTLHLGLLFFQAPAIGASMLLLFDGDIFQLSGTNGGDAIGVLMALHIVTAAAIFLGASNSAQEITKEAAVYARERLANLLVVPYVMSKMLVLSVLCLVQAALLVGVFAIGIDLSPLGDGIYPQLIVAIFLTEVAGLAMGLLISSIAANSDRAMALVPVALIPQLIFAGALVPFDKMPLVGDILSYGMISRWALQLTGGIADLSARFDTQFPRVFSAPYVNQFDDAMWVRWVILAGFAVGMTIATMIVQKRKDVL